MRGTLRVQKFTLWERKLPCVLQCCSALFICPAECCKQVQLTQFDLQSSALIKEDEQHYLRRNTRALTTGFLFVYHAVLTGLVQNKVYADPYIGINNMLIPDASDSFNHQYHLEQYSFYRAGKSMEKTILVQNIIDVPAADKDKIFQLIFKGINYRAEVWLNES